MAPYQKTLVLFVLFAAGGSSNFCIHLLNLCFLAGIGERSSVLSSVCRRLRFRGVYLAISTLAMHYAIIFLATTYQSNFTRSASAGLTIPDPSIGPFVLKGDVKWYYFLLAFLTLVTIVCVNLMRTRPGRAWMAIRDRDIASSTKLGSTWYAHTVTPGTLYLAHFAGGAGAVAILSAMENADAAHVMATADATGRTKRASVRVIRTSSAS